MKSITTFQAFGLLKKVGEPKPYTKKTSGEESLIQNYSVNGLMFSLFGENQINFHESLVGLPVIVFGRIERKEFDGQWKTNFQADSVRKDFSEVVSND